jgi:hypothetical protein
MSGFLRQLCSLTLAELAAFLPAHLLSTYFLGDYSFDCLLD